MTHKPDSQKCETNMSDRNKRAIERFNKKDFAAQEAALDLIIEMLPEIGERLKTFSNQSHLGSYSETVYLKFAMAYQQFTGKKL